jgi:hypothetical protein
MSAVQKMENQEIVHAGPHQAHGGALTPMDMLNTALTRGADMAVLERLMGLQERWEANQARKAFDAAISAAKAKIKPISRTAKGHNDKLYADFAAIAREVDPILSEYGLSYRFRTEQTDRIHVTCILSHKDGHSETTTLAGPADTSGSKNAIQAIGSTLSYLQRYSIIQMLGLATAKDDDGQATGKKPADDDGPALSEDQVKKIRDALAFKGVNEDKFVQYVLKVSALENVLARFFDDVMAKIQSAGVKK